MRVLVTGSAGFIGWKVCEFLLRNGHAVVGVDNLNDAYDVRLKQWRLAQIEAKPGFEFHRLDICDRDALRSLFPVRRSRFDAVINLAARAGVRQSVENPWVYYETNVTGCLNLLEMCKEFEINKFVLASTSSLYGDPTQSSVISRQSPVWQSTVDRRPSTFALSRAFTEADPTDRPLSPYAASKKAAEVLCHTYHCLHPIDVTVLRYFTVYGPAGRPDMSLFRFVQRISEGVPITVYGDGLQSRDFTYVDDIARGTVAGLRSVGYEVVNLGSDQPIVLNEAVRVIERLVDRNARIESKPRHPADVMATWADIRKAKRLLGWQPLTKFEEGSDRLVAWYKDNRDWGKDIRTD